jgi:hypothetical protein
MPAYCTNCGSPVSGSFCGSCGQKVQASAAGPGAPTLPSTPPPPAVGPYSAQAATPPSPLLPPAAPGPLAPAAAPKSSGLGKPLLIGCAIVVVLFAAGIAGSIYSMRWVKAKVASYTGGIVGGSPAEVQVGHGNACSLLSREEVQQILGVPIDRTVEIVESSEPGCAYYTNPAGIEQLRNLAIEQARKQAQEAQNQPAEKTDNPLALLKDGNQLEGVIKSLTLSQGGDKQGRVFSFTVDHSSGAAAWTSLRATMSVIPGFQEIPGLGDHAMIGSFGHLMFVVKGNNAIALDVTWVPDARTRGSDMARKIMPRL